MKFVRSFVCIQPSLLSHVDQTLFQSSRTRHTASRPFCNMFSASSKTAPPPAVSCSLNVRRTGSPSKPPSILHGISKDDWQEPYLPLLLSPGHDEAIKTGFSMMTLDDEDEDCLLEAKTHEPAFNLRPQFTPNSSTPKRKSGDGIDIRAGSPPPRRARTGYLDRTASDIVYIGANEEQCSLLSMSFPTNEKHDEEILSFSGSSFEVEICQRISMKGKA